MSLYTIATQPDANYKQRTNLDGTDYTLTFTYNQREGCYYLSIGTAVDVDIVSGIKIVCNFSLLDSYNEPGQPPGVLMAIAQGPNNAPPNLGELGENARVTLCYASVA